MKPLSHYLPLQRVASLLLIVGGMMLLVFGKSFPGAIIMLIGGAIASFRLRPR
jgi:hypothetical protein